MAITEESLRRTNEVPGTRATLRNLRTSAYKVRVVLDLVRGKSVAEARDILRFTDRGPAEPILKLLNSAVANAEHNDEQRAEELIIGACYADEGVTMKRFRPRAKGRASKIRKRGSHITIVVSRMDDEALARLAETEASSSAGRSSRTNRVAGSRAGRVAASQSAQTEEAESAAPEEKNEAVEAASAESIETNAPAESDTAVAAEETTTDESTETDAKEGK